MKKLEILKNLVGFNSINDLDNDKINTYIGNYLKNKGFKLSKIYNKSKDKYCLVATYGNNINLTFSGHTDTVNITETWNINPHRLTIKDDKLYGLGVCDMKGGIAAFLDALDKIDLKKLKKGIQIILTYDEEKNFEGINLIKDNKVKVFDNILIGEPTDLTPVIGTKGCMEYEVTFNGKACHSSELIFGVNAIKKCHNFMNELYKLSEILKTNINDEYNIPYATMNIGVIKGGTSINIVPDHCQLSFDFRTVDVKQHQFINDKIKELAKQHQAEIKKITDIYPVHIKSKENIKFYEEITNRKSNNLNYVTEGSFYGKNNIIILGPGPITAHKTNEYITIWSYNKTIEYYIKIIEKYCNM